MRIAVSGYTEDEIMAALHNEERHDLFKYELLGRNLQYKHDLTTVVQASIQYNSNDSITRTARFLMRDEAVDYLSCRIRPVFMLKMPDGGFAKWPLGVFVLATPQRNDSAQGVTRDIEAYDLNIVLKNDGLRERVFFPAGTFYTDAARSLIVAAGVSTANVPHSELRMGGGVEFEVGRDRLAAINELLAAINYVPLFPDELGVYTTYYNREPQRSDIAYRYLMDDSSVIKPNTTVESVDYFNVPNRFIAYTSSPNVPSLMSVWENNDPLSLLSTRNRDTVTVTQEIADIANQSELDKYVQDWAREAMQVPYTVSFETALMPFHGHRDMYQFSNDKLNINDTFREISWEMDLSAGGSMTHTARRVPWQTLL